jgi:hypothetical protein
MKGIVMVDTTQDAAQDPAPATKNEQPKGGSKVAQNSYADWLRDDLGGVIDMLDLTDLQKHYMRSRWLDQVIWMEGRAGQARDRYYLLRRTTIIGGALVPALVGLNSPGGSLGEFVYWLIFGISLVVAVTAALDEFHSFNERWRHYRSIVEELKVIGWSYIQLGGQFANFKTHKEAYVTFVNKIEEIIQRDVEIYVSTVAAPKQRRQADEDAQTQDGVYATSDERSPILP